MKRIIYMLVLVHGGLIAQTKTVVTQYGEKVTISPFANNGLTANNGYIQLGGALTQPSVLTTTSAYTLAIMGLQTGGITDNILVADANGVLKTISRASLNSNNWALDGNTNGVLKTIGTKDNFDLPFITNNTERMRLTALDGFLGIGTSAPLYGIQMVHESQIAGWDKNTMFNVRGYGLANGPNWTMDRARGTIAAPLDLQIGDQIGAIGFRGYATGSFNSLAGIESIYRGSSKANMAFTVNGSYAMYIDENRNVGIGTSTPTTVLHIKGTNPLRVENLQAGNASTDNIVVADVAGVIKTVTSASLNSNNWDIRGNMGTSATTNFLGTKDNVDLVFKRNNIQSGRLSANNTSFGVNALTNASPGGYNVAFGTDVLSNNTDYYNTGIGYQALKANTSGSSNIGIGYQPLITNTTGDGNIAVGTYTLNLNTTGSNNIAVGHQTLGMNTTGNNNTGLGYMTMVNLNSGNYNAGFGASSLQTLGTGSMNVAMGYQSGMYAGISNTQNTTSDNSVFIGSISRPAAVGQTNQVVIGYNALGRGSNTVQIGNSSMTSIGGQVAWSNTSDVRLKKDISTSPYGLTFISRLRPVTYFLKSGPTDLQTGFIAQEVEAAANAINYKFSGIVKPQNDQDFYSLRYSEFVVPLVKAVQEQQTQIEKQQSQLDQQQKDIDQLKELVQKLMAKK